MRIVIEAILTLVILIFSAIVVLLLSYFIIEDFVRTSWRRWRRSEKGVFAAWVAVGVAILLLAACWHSGALAKDDGRYAQSPLKKWFDKLQSKKGPCCSDADGFAVSDPDWENIGGKYRVRIKGQWHDVPPDALITVPNLVGKTMVWPIEIGSEVHIRCFMPGAMG